MRHWMLVVGWFALLFVWNFATKTSLAEDHSFIERCVISVEYLLAPIEIIASIAAFVAIGKLPLKSKPHA